MDVLELLQTVGICVGALALVVIAFSLFVLTGVAQSALRSFGGAAPFADDVEVDEGVEDLPQE